MRFTHPFVEGEHQEKLKLDAADKKILQLVCDNCRYPLAKIAKAVGLSRDTVAYRIRKYEQEGIIQGYRAIIDADVMEYLKVHFFVLLTKEDPEIEKELIKESCAHPFTRAVLQFSGNWDFQLACIAKDIKHLSEMAAELGRAEIQEQEMALLTKTYIARWLPLQFMKGISLKFDPGKNDSSFHADFGKKKKVHLDAADMKLLRIVGEEPRLSLLELGRRLKTSADTAGYRLRQLVQSGVITRFTALINYSALDYHVYVVFVKLNNMTPESEAKMKEVLSQNQNVLWATGCIGKWNLLMYVCVNHPAEFHNTMNSLRSQFSNMRSYEASLAYKEYKFTYAPDGLFE